MTAIGRWALASRHSEDGPLPRTDARQFRAACFEAATLTSREGAQIVLCHASWPVIAFTAVPPAPLRPVTDFVSPPPYADVFENAGFEVLAPAALNTPSSALDLTELTRAERADLRYWRPGTVGELLFNWWD